MTTAATKRLGLIQSYVAGPGPRRNKVGALRFFRQLVPARSPAKDPGRGAGFCRNV